ncbi:MAG: hypothetical protein ACP5NW_05970 [Candidatus Woesearchaeota archaeon]
MSLIEIIKGVPVNAIFFDKDEISEVLFEYDAKEYSARFSKKGISLMNAIDGRHDGLVAELDSVKNKAYWYIDHCCGASGFGLRPDDMCIACKTPSGKIEEATGNYGILLIDGRGYSRGLSEILHKNLFDFKKRYESGFRKL